MSHLKFYDYPNFGVRTRKDLGASQAVRIGDIIETAGQGGWDRFTEEFPESPEQEVAQAFENVQEALVQAGGKGWSEVYFVRVYILDGHWDALLGLIAKYLKQWTPTEGHEPVLTGVEVKGLYSKMKIEIEVKAHVASSK